MRLIANGVVLALHWLSFFAAIQVSTVAVGLLGFASFPLFTLLAERVFFARRLRRREGVTALLVTAGLVLLVPELSLANPVVQGLAWGLVSGFTFALLVVMNRRWIGNANGHRHRLLAKRPCRARVAAFRVGGALTSAPIGAREIMLLIVLGLVCTALAHTLFIGGLAVVTAHTASVIAALEPVYGIVLALVFLGEVPGARTIAGGALIVAAAVIATRRSHLVARELPSRLRRLGSIGLPH